MSATASEMGDFVLEHDGRGTLIVRNRKDPALAVKLISGVTGGDLFISGERCSLKTTSYGLKCEKNPPPSIGEFEAQGPGIRFKP